MGLQSLASYPVPLRYLSDHPIHNGVKEEVRLAQRYMSMFIDIAVASLYEAGGKEMDTEEAFEEAFSATMVHVKYHLALAGVRFNQAGE